MGTPQMLDTAVRGAGLDGLFGAMLSVARRTIARAHRRTSAPFQGGLHGPARILDVADQQGR
jgi:hypothetical protein